MKRFLVALALYVISFTKIQCAININSSPQLTTTGQECCGCCNGGVREPQLFLTYIISITLYHNEEVVFFLFHVLPFVLRALWHMAASSIPSIFNLLYSSVALLTTSYSMIFTPQIACEQQTGNAPAVRRLHSKWRPERSHFKTCTEIFNLRSLKCDLTHKS